MNNKKSIGGTKPSNVRILGLMLANGFASELMVLDNFGLTEDNI
jgi:hypothetical protein